jgi:hypothetical protein
VTPAQKILTEIRAELAAEADARYEPSAQGARLAYMTGVDATLRLVRKRGWPVMLTESLFPLRPIDTVNTDGLL